MKLLEQARQHDPRVMSLARSGPNRKALRRQKKLAKKKKAIMLSEKASRIARKRARVEEEEEEEKEEEREEAHEAHEAHVALQSESSAEEVAAEASKSAYVPPHLRGRTEDGGLAKAVRGILNKVAEGTLVASAQQVAALVREHPRGAVAAAVARAAMADATAEAASAVTHKLVAVYAALAGLLYHEHGLGLLLPSELAEAAAAAFDRAHEAGEAAQCHNAAALLAHLYLAGLVGPGLVLELARRLAAAFGPLEVEALLALMQPAGMRLRADAPGELAEVLALAAPRAAAVAGDSEAALRTRFAAETLASIKNNRYTAADPHLAQIAKALRSQRGATATVPPRQPPLRCSWSDLAQARATGQRWWLQAGAESILEKRTVGEGKEMSTTATALPADLALLARRLRINTETRRQIFAIVMTAEGFADAFEKLEKLQLRGRADRDLVFVLVECCVAEAVYNLYYALLAARVCEHHRACALTLQFHLWDQLRELGRFSEPGRRNLALFIRDLLALGCLSLRVFEPIDFVADMGASAKALVNTVLAGLVADLAVAEAALVQIFEGLARRASEEAKLLREGLLLFVRFSLTFRKEQVNVANRAVVKRRLALAKEALQHVVLARRGTEKDAPEDE